MFYNQEDDRGFEDVGFGILDPKPDQHTLQDMSEVPHTIEDYARLTGKAFHWTLHEKDPARPAYHGQRNEFPDPPFGSLREDAALLFYCTTPRGTNRLRQWAGRRVLEHHGKDIVTAIMAATYDGKITPDKVFVKADPAPKKPVALDPQNANNALETANDHTYKIAVAGFIATLTLLAGSEYWQYKQHESAPAPQQTQTDQHSSAIIAPKEQHA